MLGIDPFDQPNVQESKDNTKRLLAGYIAGGELLERRPARETAVCPTRCTTHELRGRARGVLRPARSEGDYVALQAYVAPDAPRRGDDLQALRLACATRCALATTLGYGPRFLHSTGQLHKGGPNTGVFLQLVAQDREDVEIPGQPFSFASLKRAQARGDLGALRAHGCRALRVDLGDDPWPACAASARSWRGRSHRDIRRRTWPGMTRRTRWT